MYKEYHEYDTEEEEDIPITLSIRQPSFSNLRGTPIPKGSSVNFAETIDENCDDDPVIVLSEKNANDHIGMNYRQSSFINLQGTPIPKGGNYIQSASMKDINVNNFHNEQRWKDIGYDPNELKNNSESTPIPIKDMIRARPLSRLDHIEGTGTLFSSTIKISLEDMPESNPQAEGDFSDGLPSELHLGIQKILEDNRVDSDEDQESQQKYPELYMLRRVMNAAYRVVDALRSNISFIKKEN